MTDPHAPLKPCWVLHDGAWREGWLLDWYRVDDRWRARVEFTDGPGLIYRLAKWATDLRPREDDTYADR